VTTKCDDCGRFIKDIDIISGAALLRQITPDSHLTIEEWEALCPVCKSKPHPTPGKEEA